MKAIINTMKTSKFPYFILLIVGIFIMAFCGSGIARYLNPNESHAASFLLLPGYSLGLIIIAGAMVGRLDVRVKDLESRLQKFEDVSK
jgi:hypothetical protein